jgi:hypothetical protein
MSSPDKDLECVICGPWPESERALMRIFLCTAIPLTETVCDECIAAFFVYMSEERDGTFLNPNHPRRPLKPKRH